MRYSEAYRVGLSRSWFRKAMYITGPNIQGTPRLGFSYRSLRGTRNPKPPIVLLKVDRIRGI